MRSVVFSCLSTLLAAGSGWAQTAPVPPNPSETAPCDPVRCRWHLESSGVVGSGLGQFGDRVGMVGGIAFTASRRLSESPWSLGADGSYIWYRADVGLEPPDRVSDSPFASSVRAFEYSSAMGSFHTSVRLQPGKGRVRPYVEALLGFALITTDRVFTPTPSIIFDTPEEETRVVHTDAGLSYGGRIGVTIELTSWSASQSSLGRLSVGAVSATSGARRWTTSRDSWLMRMVSSTRWTSVGPPSRRSQSRWVSS